MCQRVRNVTETQDRKRRAVSCLIKIWISFYDVLFVLARAIVGLLNDTFLCTRRRQFNLNSCARGRALRVSYWIFGLLSTLLSVNQLIYILSRQPVYPYVTVYPYWSNCLITHHHKTWRQLTISTFYDFFDDIWFESTIYVSGLKNGRNSISESWALKKCGAMLPQLRVNLWVSANKIYSHKSGTFL